MSPRTAVKQLGLVGEVAGRDLIQRADACLVMLRLPAETMPTPEQADALSAVAAAARRRSSCRPPRHALVRRARAVLRDLGRGAEQLLRHVRLPSVPQPTATAAAVAAVAAAAAAAVAAVAAVVAAANALGGRRGGRQRHRRRPRRGARRVRGVALLPPRSARDGGARRCTRCGARAAALVAASRDRERAGEPRAELGGEAAPAPSSYVSSYEVVATMEHDPSAFTQGLAFDAHGRLFESDGLYHQSRVREVDPATRSVRTATNSPSIFGEGVARRHRDPARGRRALRVRPRPQAEAHATSRSAPRAGGSRPTGQRSS